MARTKSRRRAKNPSYRKRYTRKHRFSTAGKVFPPLDVRKPSQLKEFERRLKKGPLTIIMVYADWCGHCHTMMPHFDAASKSPSRSIQSVKVNEEMLNSVNNHINKNVNRSAKPLEVEGYPSIILVDNKGDKVTDIDTVRDTNTMTKVMSQPMPNANGSASMNESVSMNKSSKPTNANLGLTANNSYSGLVNKAKGSLNARNMNVGENELKGSLSANKRVKPDDMLIRSEDVTKPLRSNNKANNKKIDDFDLSDSIAPSPIETFSLPKDNDKEPDFSAPAKIEKVADSLVNMRGPIEPPSPESDLIQNSSQSGGGCGCGMKPVMGGGGRKGGSLISSISHAAYTLATPAALLATASYVMRKNGSKRSGSKRSSSKRSGNKKVTKRKTHRRR